MKNVRIWFKKCGTAKYISHLDLNRCVARAFHKAKLPMWYTEGFNPHAFVTFALPLSLGVSGQKESMDIKMIEDLPKEEIILRLNKVLPQDLVVYDVTEPVMKPGKIAHAEYEIRYEIPSDEGKSIETAIRKLFEQSEILVDKRSKSGIKEVNLALYLDKWKLIVAGNELLLTIVLPAGSTDNVNPSLLQVAIKQYLGYDLFAQITRTNLYNAEFELFA